MTDDELIRPRYWTHGVFRPPTRPGPPRQPINHGTRAGAVVHRSRGEKPCGECLEADAAYRRARRATRKNTADIQSAEKGRQ